MEKYILLKFNMAIDFACYIPSIVKYQSVVLTAMLPRVLEHE